MGECPKGYPRLAAFIDSDENFMLYRRFGFLQARLLLYKQDRLRALETKLDELDKDDERHCPDILVSRAKDDIIVGKRMNLMHEIEVAFIEYGGFPWLHVRKVRLTNEATLLCKNRELGEFSKPPPTDYESVQAFFHLNAPLVYEETYIRRKEDIITLKPGRESAWLDALILKLLLKFSNSAIRVSQE